VTNSVVRALTATGINAVENDRAADGEQPQSAATRLGTTMMLTGQLTVIDQRLSVSLRMLRVEDGHALWAWSFDAPYDEHRPQLQDEIAKRAADGVKSYLSLSGAEPVTR
jgi:TolB-like protein